MELDLNNTINNVFDAEQKNNLKDAIVSLLKTTEKIPISTNVLSFDLNEEKMMKDHNNVLKHLIETGQGTWFERTWNFFGDLLIRRQSFDNFIDHLKALEETEYKYLYENIDSQILLIALVEATNKLDYAKLGKIISNSYYGIPFFYTTDFCIVDENDDKPSNKKFILNFDILRDSLLKNEKNLITSITFENNLDSQDILHEIFEIKKSNLNNDQVQVGEFFVDLPIDFDYIVANMRNLPEQFDEIHKINLALLDLSTVILTN